MVTESWAKTGGEQALLREAAVRRLLELKVRDELTAGHIAMVAGLMNRTPRTVRRWVENAGGQAGRARFEIDDALRVRLAYHRGNATALHEELVEQARASGGRAPSVHTVRRAVRRELTRGERDGLRRGERARRARDVFLRRPEVYRNAVWEGDHVEASVEVDVDGQLRKPWVTWFVDCATNAICGAAITPSYPSRESVLTALRASISRAGGFGPFGGLPGMIRVDRGKDFLSRTVTAAFDLLDVTVEDLPAYTPHLKGTVEGLNRVVEPMFLAALPGYARQPRPGKRPARPKDEVLLDFEDFTARLLEWVQWWNTSHQPAPLGGRTPLQAWQDDPTPLRDIPATV